MEELVWSINQYINSVASQPLSSYSQQNEKVKNCTKPLISELSKYATLRQSTYLERAEQNPMKRHQWY